MLVGSSAWLHKNYWTDFSGTWMDDGSQPLCDWYQKWGLQWLSVHPCIPGCFKHCVYYLWSLWYLECQVAGISCQVSSGHPLPRLPNPMHCMSREEDGAVDRAEERRHLQDTCTDLLNGILTVGLDTMDVRTDMVSIPVPCIWYWYLWYQPYLNKPTHPNSTLPCITCCGFSVLATSLLSMASL